MRFHVPLTCAIVLVLVLDWMVSLGAHGAHCRRTRVRTVCLQRQRRPALKAILGIVPVSRGRIVTPFAVCRPGYVPQQKTFGALSGGMKQKALLARAFVSGADVVLLDEPTSELDEPTEAEVLGHLRRLVAEEGRTVVFVHHGLHQAAALTERICWVEHGLARMVASAEALSRSNGVAGGRP